MLKGRKVCADTAEENEWNGNPEIYVKTSGTGITDNALWAVVLLNMLLSPTHGPDQEGRGNTPTNIVVRRLVVVVPD